MIYWVFGLVAFRQNAKRMWQKSYQSYSKKDGECFNYIVKKGKTSQIGLMVFDQFNGHLFLMLFNSNTKKLTLTSE
jgi:hypothetical protein